MYAKAIGFTWRMLAKKLAIFCSKLEFSCICSRYLDKNIRTCSSFLSLFLPPFFFFFEHFSRWQSHNPTGLEHNINSFYVIKCFHLACPIHLMRIPRSRCCSAFHRGRKLRILFCGCAKKNVAEESKIVPAIDIEYLYLFFIFFYVNISLSRLSNSYHYIKFLKTKGKIYL